MKKMNLIQLTLFVLFSSILISATTLNAQKWRRNYGNKVVVTRTLTVDKSGGGNFTNVQDAIDSVPANNNAWVKIYINPGIYTEKVSIPSDKQFIALEGGSRANTVIQYGDYGKSIESATFSASAANFVAHNITFMNTYNKMLPRSTTGNPITWAPAILIQGDKSAFYGCAFLSLQDTVSDISGRHYFRSCYIRGAIDFIWGSGQSIYEKCVLNVITASLPNGRGSYITAQGRNSTEDGSGYVFRECLITGSGPAYLGRAYGKFSRVLFYRSRMENIITPVGWGEWNYKGSDGCITYAEIGNFGPGSDTSGRVKWEMKMSPEDVQSFVQHKYINQDHWLEQQPLGLYN